MTKAQKKIVDSSMDLEKQVLGQVKELIYFAILLDESADLSNCTILICFVQYENDGNIKKELLTLSCVNLSGRTTNSEIFRLPNNYLQKAYTGKNV